jgi:hypothetical protein
MTEDPHDEPAEQLPEFDAGAALDAQLARRRSPRRLAAQIGSVALALLVGVVFLIRYTPLIHSGILVPIVPTARAGPGGGTVLVTANVSGGALIVNGKSTLLQRDSTVQLHTGVNMLELDAPPFHPVRCTVMWPQVQSTPQEQGSCMTDPEQDAPPLVEFGLGTPELDPALVATAQATIATQLSVLNAGKVVVSPGQHYGLGTLDTSGAYPAIGTFAVPTHVQLQASLAIPPGVGIPLNTCQQGICPLNGGLPLSSSVSPLRWQILAFVNATWRFTNSQNGAITSLPANPSARGPFSMMITLVLEFDGATWSITTGPDQFSESVSQQIFDDTCTTPMRRVAGIVPNSPFSAYTFGHSSLQGCELSILNTAAPAPEFIERFGALLAENTAAHQLAPSLPMATPGEIAAVLNS